MLWFKILSKEALFETQKDKQISQMLMKKKSHFLLAYIHLEYFVLQK